MFITIVLIAVLGRCPDKAASVYFHLPQEHVRTARPYSDYTSQRKLRGLHWDLLRLCPAAFSAVTSCRLVKEQTMRQPSCRIPKWIKENFLHHFPWFPHQQAQAGAKERKWGCLTCPPRLSPLPPPQSFWNCHQELFFHLSFLSSFPCIIYSSSSLMPIKLWWMG